jgi:hypothetical protein
LLFSSMESSLNSKWQTPFTLAEDVSSSHECLCQLNHHSQCHSSTS